MGSLGGGVFTLRLGLGAVQAELNEVATEFGDRLDGYQPRLAESAAGLELSLTVAASDLWVAVLLAMAAVTGVGYAVVRLEAWPVEPTTAQPDRAIDQEINRRSGPLP